MEYTSIPVTPCQNCGKVFDCVVPASVKNIQPKEGNLTICTSCGVLGQFTADLTIRLFPPEDFSLLPIEVRNEIKEAQMILRAIWERKKRRSNDSMEKS